MRMLNHPFFKGLVNHHLNGIDQEILQLPPADTEEFTALSYQKQGVCNFLSVVHAHVTRGQEARMRLKPDYKPEEPHAL